MADASKPSVKTDANQANASLPMLTPTPTPMDPELESVIIPHPTQLASTTPISVAIASLDSETDGNWTGDCLLIMEEQTLVGIVTTGDLLRGIRQQVGTDPPISAIMTTPVITIGLEALTDVSVPLAVLEQHRISQLPVMDGGGRVVGLVTHERLSHRLTAELQRQGDREQLLAHIASQIHISLNLADILTAVVTEVRSFLKSDRVIVYQFQPDWSGTIIAESLANGWPSALHHAVADSCFQSSTSTGFNCLELYSAGRAIAVADINTADYSDCHLELLSKYAVKAHLIVPIHVSGQLWGLLVGHHCADIHPWHGKDLPFLEEIAVQLAIAIQHAQIHQQMELDISNRKHSEALLQVQNQILEHIAKAEPLTDCLHLLVQVIELQLPHSTCSILLCDADGRLHVAAAPGLPAAYNAMVEGLEIGDGVGSCGTAASRGETVIVADITTHPYWEKFRAIAAEFGLGACWSMPIFDTQNRVMGTFAVYYPIPQTPTPQALETMTVATNMASIAIEQHQMIQALRVLNQELELRVQERTKALQVSEHRYASLSEAAPVAIFRLDASGNCIDVNEQWSLLLNRPKTDAMEVGCFQTLHPDDRDRIFRDWQLKFEQHEGIGTGYHTECRHLRPNGDLIWTFLQVVPETDGDGHLIGYVGTITDISDRKAAELETERLRERLQFVLSSSPAAIFTCRPDPCLSATFISDNIEDVMGYPAEQWLTDPNTWIDHVHPEDWPRLVQQIPRLFVENNLIWEYRFRHPNGEYRWKQDGLRVVRDEQLRPREVVGYTIDISDRKQVESALQLSEAQFRTAFNGTAVGMALVDLRGQFVQVNAALCRFLGYTEAELMHRSFQEITYPDDLPANLEFYTKALKGEIDHYECEKRYIHKQRHILWALLSVSLIRDQNGNALYFVTQVQNISGRKHTELALQESKRFIQQIADSSPNILYLYDLNEERNLYVNREITKILGYTPTEVQAMGDAFLPSVVHPDDFAHLPEQIQRLNSSVKGEIVEFEYRIRHTNGEWRWLCSRDSVFNYNPDGTVAQVVGTAEDISDRKAAEQALQDSMRRYQTLIENSPDIIQRFDLQFRHLYVSPSLGELMGLPIEAMLGKTCRQLQFDPTMVELWETAATRLLSTGENQIIEFEVAIPEGQRSFEMLMVPESDDQGTIHSILCISRDVTEHKQTEQALHQQAEHQRVLAHIMQRVRQSLDLTAILNTTVTELHQVLQCDRVLVYQIFPDGTGKAIAESVSPGWKGILGRIFPEEIFPQDNYDRYINGRIFTLTDLEVEPVLPCLANFLREMQVRAKLVVPIIQPVVQQPGENSSPTEQLVLWGLLIAHQCSGPHQWKSWEVEVLQQLSGQVAIAIQQSQLYAQLQDSHEQLSHTNAELTRATRLKDEFLANMSHELRTPLNAILGMAESLQEEVFGPVNPDQLRSLATIERSGRHLLELITDILEVSKISAGKLELEVTSVPIKLLCTSSLTFVKQLALKKQIHLESNIPEHLGTITIDQRRMRQVLINLLSNAVKFTPTGGRISLAVSIEPEELNLSERVSLTRPFGELDRPRLTPTPTTDFLCITVSDTGIGIKPDDQAKLFQPFIQIDSSLNRQYAGTGLGLTLVKQIVELHGGTIHLASTPGHGSCFTVRLPYCKQTSVPSLPPESPVMSAVEAMQRVTDTHDGLSQRRPQPQEVHRVAASGTPTTGTQPVILLAEDNEANIMTIAGYLNARHYRVVLARNGEEAIQLVQQEHPNLVLMDIQMPGMDGLEAIQYLRATTDFAKLPIIALTALAMTGDRERCLNAGANDYLTKPIRLRELSSLVEHWLRQPE